MSQTINVGLTANDHNGDKLRDAFIKVNSNFTSIDAILSTVLTDSSAIPISQITLLQDALDALASDISDLGIDVNSINASILDINNALSAQNLSIADLYTAINDLQTQINTKVEEAPIDGQQYARKDGNWVVVTGGGGGATDLSYTSSATDGTVTSSTGTDATIPLADGTNAGLLSPSEKSEIAKINKTEVKLAENISKGQAVYISSANGTNIIVSKASNATEATSSKVLGLLETTGVTNDIVNVVTFELLSGLDTSSATVGDPVWLGTSGNLIFGLASKPVAPAHLVYIGAVSRVHATNGEIFINVQNGFEINEIHDVLITSVADKQLLSYDNTTGIWKNKSVTTADISEDTNLYFTNARAIASTLTSFIAGTGAISSSDTILTAIQKLAGNSGLKKVINDTTASSSNTGVTTEVVMKTYEITGGTFVSGSKPNITIGSTKSSVSSNAVYTMRLYAGTTSTFASATLIGTYTTSSAFIRGFNFERRGFYFNGTTLKGYLPTTSARTDISELPTIQWSGMTLNPANSIFLFVTLQNGSALDTTRIDYVNITD